MLGVPTMSLHGFGNQTFQGLPSDMMTTDIWITLEGSLTMTQNDTFYDGDNDVNGTFEVPRQNDEDVGLIWDTGKIIIAVVSIVVSTITVMGNLLVLYAFCAERRLRTYTNYYIVGLSISDLVAGAFTMPMYSIYWVLGNWPFGEALCDIYLYLNHAFIHITVLGILVLAVDRYQAVSRPLKHLQKRTLRHASAMIFISYAIPFFIWLPYTILWPYFVGERRITPGLCFPQYIKDSFFFTILAPIVLFWIPLPITSVLYWRIYMVIRSASTQRRGPVMLQELSTSSSRVPTVTGDEKVPNISVEVSSQDRNLNPQILHNTDIESNQNLGHENPGFFPGEEQQPELQSNTRPSTLTTPEVGSTRSAPVPQPNPQVGKDRESSTESNRATRTLTLIFIVLMVSSIPWSIIVLIQSLCPTCLPLVLYQVCCFVQIDVKGLGTFCRPKTQTAKG